MPDLTVPEPLVLRFDPETVENEELREVFADDIARDIWLAVGSTHLRDQHFNRWCLEAAVSVREKEPETLQDLVHALNCANPVAPITQSLHIAFSEKKEFLSRLFSAVCEDNPIRFRVILPDTPEDKEWREEQYEQGVRDAEEGEGPTSLVGPYATGYWETRNKI